MNGLYAQFATNDKEEADGVWLEYGMTAPTPEAPEGLPIRIRIARAGGKNLDFNKALEKATKPHRKALAAGSMSLDLLENIYRAVFIAHCVKGWQNVSGRDGKPLAFTGDNVLQVFKDLPDLYSDVKEQANSLSLFREEEREVDLGNSGVSLSTDSNKDQ